jgi:predicted CopG family antitoxin
MNNVTQITITISRENHENLMMMGRKGQTFDDIVSELLKTKALLCKENKKNGN